MTAGILMIAFWQALAVFVLCMISANRGYAVLIGLAGCVVVSITGGNPYDVLDVVFVIVATLIAVWKLTPYKEGESPAQMAAFAGKAVVSVILIGGLSIAGLWLYSERFWRPTSAPVSVAQSPVPQVANEVPQKVIDAPLSTPERVRPTGDHAHLEQGMTEEEVRAILGPPQNVASLRSSTGVRVEAWEYQGTEGARYYIYMKNGRKSL